MKPNIAKEGAKNGAIAGFITLLILFGAWGVTNVRGFVNITGITTFIPYVIILLIVTGLSLRKANGNVLTFKDALKFAFAAYVIAVLLEGIGTYILYNWVDHDLTAKTFEIGKEKALKMMEKFGMTEDKIDEASKKMDAEAGDTGFKKIFLGMGLSLVWGFCKSLLIALIIRKEEKFED